MNYIDLPLYEQGLSEEELRKAEEQSKKDEEYKCKNRELLKSIMTEAGFRGIKREWWHYQKIGDTKAYPLINICNHPNSKCLLDKTELK